MRKIQWLAIALVLALSSCEKNSEKNSEISVQPNVSSIIEQKRKDKLAELQANNPNIATKTYHGFVDISSMPNGHFTAPYIRFTHIIYPLGSYLDGEPVAEMGIYFDPVITPNVLWSRVDGPYFVFVQGTPIGTTYSPSFLTNYNVFVNALTKFIDSGFYRKDGQIINGMPAIDDYIPSSTTNGELVTKGVVVRRHASATTFTIAPGNFTPVTFNSGYELTLGYVTQGNYDIYVSAMTGPGGLADEGALYNIEVYDINNSYQRVTIQGFVGFYEERPTTPHSGYDVEGEFTLPDNSIISFSGIANGL
jgi:hypothetical protein